MFDPDAYFEELDRLLGDCQSWASVVGPIPRIAYDAHKRWLWITWRVEVTFPSGEKLIAFESHEHKNHRHLRKLKYRFMHSDGTLIFQVDPHTHPIPFDDPPHLHRGPTQNERLHDGDWELNGLSLRDFDFRKMWELVQNYLKDGSVPWRV